MSERETNGRFGKGNQAAKGNNGGRPRRSTEERFFARLVAKVEEKDFDVMADVLVTRAMAGDVQMAKLLLGYLIGLPVQRQEISGPEGGPVEVNHHVDNDELAEALAVLGRTNGCRCG